MQRVPGPLLGRTGVPHMVQRRDCGDLRRGCRAGASVATARTPGAVPLDAGPGKTVLAFGTQMVLVAEVVVALACGIALPLPLGGTGGRPDGGNPVQGGMARTTGRPSGNGQSQGGAGRSSGTSGYEPRRQTLQGASLQIGDGGSGSGGMGGRKPQDAANRAAASRSAAQAAKKKKIRRIIVMAVAEVLTLICIGFYGYALRLNSSLIHSNDFDKSKVKNTELPVAKTEHMQGYMTIAVFGVDSRDGNVHKGTNTDVIMLCNINRDTGEIKLVSVFRDTYLNTSSGGTYNKINSAYANGGAEQALAALNRNLDLNIEDYVTFNWKSVADGINMLGGIDGIDISKAEFRYINSFITETVQKTGVPSTQLKSAGVQHLDGIQAVAYGRLRLMDTDYARTERQRLVIQKAFEKAKQADLGLLNRILLMEVEQVETSLSFSDLTSLILDIGKYHIGETGGFPFARDSMRRETVLFLRRWSRM